MERGVDDLGPPGIGSGVALLALAQDDGALLERVLLADVERPQHREGRASPPPRRARAARSSGRSWRRASCRRCPQRSRPPRPGVGLALLYLAAAEGEMLDVVGQAVLARTLGGRAHGHGQGDERGGAGRIHHQARPRGGPPRSAGGDPRPGVACAQAHRQRQGGAGRQRVATIEPAHRCRSPLVAPRRGADGRARSPASARERPPIAPPRQWGSASRRSASRLARTSSERRPRKRAPPRVRRTAVRGAAAPAAVASARSGPRAASAPPASGPPIGRMGRGPGRPAWRRRPPRWSSLHARPL